MTAREMIRRSLMLGGVLAEGESLTADQGSDGLTTLNELLASWSIEGMTVFAKVREELSWTSGNASRTIGATGNFATARPLEIENAAIKDANSIETPLDILNADEWAALADKATTGTQGTKLYFEPNFPNGTLYLYPVASATQTLVLYSRKALTAVSSLSTEISLPPGYDRAIRFNLWVDMAPEYGKAVSPEVASIAMESKAAIKRQNKREQTLTMDLALTLGGEFDINTGGFN